MDANRTGSEREANGKLSGYARRGTGLRPLETRKPGTAREETQATGVTPAGAQRMGVSEQQRSRVCKPKVAEEKNRPGSSGQVAGGARQTAGDCGRQAVGSRRQATSVRGRQQAPGDKRQAMGSRRWAADGRRQTAGTGRQAVRGREQAVRGREQADINRKKVGVRRTVPALRTALRRPCGNRPCKPGRHRGARPASRRSCGRWAARAPCPARRCRA